MLELSRIEKRFLLFFMPFFLLGCLWHYYRKASAGAVRIDWQADQKERIRDFAQPFHPSPKPALPSSMQEQKHALISGKVNINTATERELVRLPRIGPVMAKRIIEHRTLYGPFQKSADLMDVKGIGEKTYQRIRDQVIIE